MAIKFETIKRNAIREFYNRMGGNNQGLIGLGDSTVFLALREQITSGKPAREVLKEWTDYGSALINAWDVRGVSKLVELFPSSVPKNWQGIRLCAYMADNDNCDWMIEPVAGGS